MTSHKLGLNKNQRGFTLIELLVVAAITGMISSGVTMTFLQIVNGSARSSNCMTALSQVQNAGYWVTHDAQLAQGVAVDEGEDTGFPLTLTWTSWDNTEHTVTYTLADTELWRDDGGQQTPIARFIDAAGTNVEFTDTNDDGLDDTVTLTITATVGGGLQGHSETKVYRVVPRPRSQ